MRTVEIPRYDCKRFGDYEYMDWFDDLTDGIWTEVYDGIQSEEIPFAYYDDGKKGNPNCYKKFVCHRSPKQKGYVQISAMLIRNEKIDPSYDCQENTLDGFLREMRGANGITLHIGSWEEV